jgi:transposase InsO family protein
MEELPVPEPSGDELLLKMHHYNHARRHSSIGNRPPVSRVRNVLRQDS